jgi:hypothetical protein
MHPQGEGKFQIYPAVTFKMLAAFNLPNNTNVIRAKVIMRQKLWKD